VSRTRLIAIGVALAVVTLFLLGLLLPNRDPTPVEFMWWQIWELPLWATMSLCILGGGIATSLGTGLLWALERRERRRSEARVREIEGEVTELRRLLARDAVEG